MAKIFFHLNPPKKAAVLSALALCLFLFSIIQCGFYTEQTNALAAENAKLSTALTDREQTIQDNAGEMKRIQKQLAEADAKTENLNVTSCMNHDYALREPTDCEKLESHLADCSGFQIRAEISSWELDVQETAKALRTYWERNEKRDGAYVSMTIYPENWWEPPENAEKCLSDLYTALTALAGAEYTEIIEDTLAQETGYLWFVRLDRIDGLTCCTFEISEISSEPNTYEDPVDSYYIILEGTWEGKEVQRQCLRIPYTRGERHCIGTNPEYLPEKVDLDFDGKSDLLIHEGSASGSGGSWSHYRALTWKEDTGQFACFSSFPEQAVSLEFDQQRVVNHWRSGVSEECVEIYGVVNGEYVCTRKLLLQSKHRGEEFVEKLLYYEMDKLVETHVLSGDWYEKVELYPDMAYWSKG